MTTEQMKELYASGEWICLTRFPWQEWEVHSCILKVKLKFDGKLLQYQLIHTKHAKVLSHVLAGGEVRSELNCSIQNTEHFFKLYNEDDEYEIIKEKQSLNGKYCLATKAHYEQLVKDGREHEYTFDEKAKYILLNNHNRIILCMSDYFHPSYDTPMHYNKEKGEWMFGSLESDRYAGVPKELIEAQRVGTPKQVVDRITREELVEAYLDDKIDIDDIHNISDYIEYLETNQKDK